MSFKTDASGITYVAPHNQVVKLKEGDDVVISTRSLFDEESPITLGHVVREVNDEFVLYNENAEPACFNGETCRIYQIGNRLITFANNNGDGTIFFALTLEEARTALFPSDDIFD